MADHPYLSYIFIAIFVAFIVAIFTENSVMKRISYSDGVMISAGRCKLRPGYGPTANNETSDVRVQLEAVKVQLDNIMAKMNKQ